MKKYLIMQCKLLGDQWECDANRTPLVMVNNYEEWLLKNIDMDLLYQFEVYELIEDKFKLILSYDDIYTLYIESKKLKEEKQRNKAKKKHHGGFY